MINTSKKNQKSQSGIALFMVISSLALLSMLVAELTYSSQMNARLAYNYIDNVKAYYLAKAGYKISLIRLRAYMQIRDFLNDPKNKDIKSTLGKNFIDMVWGMPFIFPLIAPKEATMGESDAFKEFMTASKLAGTFQALISSESTKLNLNNLLVENIPTPTASPTPGTPPGTPPSTPNPAPTPTPTSTPMDFKQTLIPTIDSLLEQRRTTDREFADVYRNVSGKDIVDAMMAYLKDGSPSANLPGFKPMKAKNAPFYSLSELHLIPGIDDGLYNLIAPSVTVYSTPGINVNKIDKPGLRGLIFELTDDDADAVLRKRDDPDAGQPFDTEQSFWDAITATSAGKAVDNIKKRLAASGVQIVVDEQSFKIGVLATVGQSTRRLEAYVTLDSTSASKQGSTQPGQPPNPQPTPTAQPGQQANGASAQKTTGLNLIYWRML